MDGSSGKRIIERNPSSRKDSGVVFRDRINNRDQKVPIGSAGNINPMKGKEPVGPFFLPSSNGKEIIGTSSRTCSRARKSSCTENEKKLLLSQIETDTSDSSSVHDDPEIMELNLHLGSENTGCRDLKPVEAESSSHASSTRTRRCFGQRFGLGNQEILVGSSASQTTDANTMSRYGVRNLRCNSMLSDAVLSGFPSHSRLSRKKDTVKKRNSDGESSSSFSYRGRKVIGLQAGGRNGNSNHGISISDTRQARTSPLINDNGVASVRTQRSISSYSGTINRGTGRNSLSSTVIPEMPQPEASTVFNSPISVEISPGSSQVENSGSVMNRDGFHHYNIDGIAEHLLSLETSLFLSGLNLYDQHRDMRLDIDNMSYEELLALEERMGTVSTALTEEAISECLKTSFYQLTPSDSVTMSSCGDEDEFKCSICQEEYRVGDEVGRLHCEHRYHLVCIQQWLRLKNRCPVCKASAEPPSL